MSYKEEQFQKTKQELYKALERIIKGNITNPELLDKKLTGKLKVNRLSVEKEAGLSVGVLRNHLDVVEKINNYNNTNENSNKNLKNEEVKKLKNKNKEQKEEIENLNEAMSKQLAEHQMLMVALAEELSPIQKENILKFNLKE